uniref:Uncharacterized protein n=1 Tax=Arundo donax TaxID=35708 RepID=A0A0A9F0I4_ARUDO
MNTKGVTTDETYHSSVKPYTTPRKQRKAVESPTARLSSSIGGEKRCQ